MEEFPFIKTIMNTDKTKLAALFSGSLWEAEIIQGLLKNASIESSIHDDVSGTIAPWLAASGGVDSVSLYIAEENLAEAQEIMKEYRTPESD